MANILDRFDARDPALMTALGPDVAAMVAALDEADRAYRDASAGVASAYAKARAEAFALAPDFTDRLFAVERAESAA